MVCRFQLTSALTFVIAPLPNSLCGRCAHADDLSPEYNSAYTDFGHWLTGALVVSGIVQRTSSMFSCLAVFGLRTDTRRPASRSRWSSRTLG